MRRYNIIIAKDLLEEMRLTKSHLRTSKIYGDTQVRIAIMEALEIVTYQNPDIEEKVINEIKEENDKLENWNNSLPKTGEKINA